MTDLSELEALVGKLRHVGSCDRPDGCVCGGDTPAVRSGCGYFTKDSDGLRAAQAIESLLSTIRSQEAALVEAKGCLNAVLDSSGARGTYHALDHSDAVKRSEALLSKLEGGE